MLYNSVFHGILSCKAPPPYSPKCSFFSDIPSGKRLLPAPGRSLTTGILHHFPEKSRRIRFGTHLSLCFPEVRFHLLPPNPLMSKLAAIPGKKEEEEEGFRLGRAEPDPRIYCQEGEHNSTHSSSILESKPRNLPGLE